MKDELWEKLKNFRVSQGEEQLTFVGRLARENGWGVPYAEQVYQEYLRFLYLAAVAGHPVTPSQDVDEAWHLHLCYSRSYWNDLCGAILKRELHHGPTKGGNAERSRFREQYQATLDSYRMHIGEDPPRNIWPDVKARFHPCNDHVRVNRNHSFVVPKKLVYSFGAIVLGSLVLSSCAGFIEAALDGSVFHIILIVAGVFLLVRMLIWWIRRGGDGGGCGTSGCGGGFLGCGSNSGGDSGCGGGCGGGD